MRAAQPVHALDYFRLGVEVYDRGFRNFQAPVLEEAVAHFKGALALEPNYPWARYYLGS